MSGVRENNAVEAAVVRKLMALVDKRSPGPAECHRMPLVVLTTPKLRQTFLSERTDTLG